MIVSSPRASQPHIIPIHMHILPGAKAFRQTTPSNILCAHSKLMQYRNACDRTNTCDAPNQRPLHRSHPCKSCFVFAPDHHYSPTLICPPPPSRQPTPRALVNRSSASSGEHPTPHAHTIYTRPQPCSLPPHQQPLLNLPSAGCFFSVSLSTKLASCVVAVLLAIASCEK